MILRQGWRRHRLGYRWIYVFTYCLNGFYVRRTLLPAEIRAAKFNAWEAEEREAVCLARRHCGILS